MRGENDVTGFSDDKFIDFFRHRGVVLLSILPEPHIGVDGDPKSELLLVSSSQIRHCSLLVDERNLNGCTSTRQAKNCIFLIFFVVF